MCTEPLAPPEAVDIRLPLEPVAASRPRVSKWATFYAEPYKSYLLALAEALHGMCLPMLDGPLSVAVEVVCTKPKTSKLSHPRQDVDNHAKSILDGLTKAGAWIDDSQVVRLMIEKRFASKGEGAHTRVRIEPL